MGTKVVRWLGGLGNYGAKSLVKELGVSKFQEGKGSLVNSSGGHLRFLQWVYEGRRARASKLSTAKKTAPKR